MKNRLQRLHEYIRWKVNGPSKFHILPNDVLLIILSYLTVSDVTNIVTAFCGTNVDIRIPRQLRIMNTFMIPQVVGMCALETTCRFLYSWADTALFEACHAHMICVFANWSVYDRARRDPDALVEYQWRREKTQMMKASVTIAQDVVTNLVSKCMSDGQPCVRLTMHRIYCHEHTYFLESIPMRWHLLQMFPHHALSELC